MILSKIAKRLLRYPYMLLKNIFSSRIIIDNHMRLNVSSRQECSYPTDLVREEIARKYIMEFPGNNLNFLDIGARDGKLKTSFGIKKNFKFFSDKIYNQNLQLFHEKYNYYGMDLDPVGGCKNVISEDICDANFINNYPHYLNFFDVIYSFEVMEHIADPFSAFANMNKLLKKGGIIITIVPFSQRYHEAPTDYFRYTHKCIEMLLSKMNDYYTEVSGYDISSRRIDWQGPGFSNDIVPTDNFGAWRETWYTVNVSRKL